MKQRKLSKNQSMVLEVLESGIPMELLPDATNLKWSQIQPVIGALYRRGVLSVSLPMETYLVQENVPPAAPQELVGTVIEASVGTIEDTFVEVFEAEIDDLYTKELEGGYVNTDELVNSELQWGDKEYIPDDADSIEAIQQAVFLYVMCSLFKQTVVGVLKDNGITRCEDVQTDAFSEMSVRGMASAIKNGYVPVPGLWESVQDKVLASDSIQNVKASVYADVLAYLQDYYCDGYSLADKQESQLAHDARMLKNKLELDAAIALGKAKPVFMGYEICPVWRKAKEHLYISKACKETGITVQAYRKHNAAWLA